MNGYHDRPVDEPQPVTGDRPVAGWPGHGPGQDAGHDEEQDAGTGEHRDETPGTEEPLVGEVWNDDSPGEPAGEHEDEESTGRAAETGGGRYGEPFGTEEPLIISDSTAAEETTDAEPARADGVTGHVETETAADEHATAEPAAESGTDPAVAEAAGPVGVAGEAEPVVTGARPTAADEFTVDALIDDEAAERFRARWRDVKGAFVDDPADAVRQASVLSGEAVDELTAVLGRLRDGLDGHWGEGREADTERLRVALRGYGSLIERILGR